MSSVLKKLAEELLAANPEVITAEEPDNFCEYLDIAQSHLMNSKVPGRMLLAIKLKAKQAEVKKLAGQLHDKLSMKRDDQLAEARQMI